MRLIRFFHLWLCGRADCRCSGKVNTPQPNAPKNEPAPVFFTVDPATRRSVTGTVHYKGKRPAPKLIDMSEEPACVEPIRERLMTNPVVSKSGALANAFLYVKGGLEGKTFAIPPTRSPSIRVGAGFVRG